VESDDSESHYVIPLDSLRCICVPITEVRGFLETHHYSKSINGCKIAFAFALYNTDELVGAALFGELSTTAWKKYGKSEKDVVELRRLVCLDACQRNTESWFIAKCLKHIKSASDYKTCISYADPYHGHIGIVYQAANWQYLGQTASDTMFKTPEGRLYHSRAMRTKYKGDYKPFVKKLRDMYASGLLTEVKCPGKHIYSYSLVGKQSPSKLPYPKTQ